RDRRARPLDARGVQGRRRVSHERTCGPERGRRRLPREEIDDRRAPLVERRPTIAGLLAEDEPAVARALVAHDEVDVDPAGDRRTAPRIARDLDLAFPLDAEVVRERAEESAGERPGHRIARSWLDAREQRADPGDGARRRDALERIERDDRRATGRPARSVE